MFIGYEYSNSNKDGDIANAVYERVAKDYEYSKYSRLNDASLILSMVTSIKANDNNEFYRKSCLYLKTIFPEIEGLENNENLNKARKSEIIQEINAIKEFINVGELNNNCDLKGINGTNT